jgi:hypothetical protein
MSFGGAGYGVVGDRAQFLNVLDAVTVNSTSGSRTTKQTQFRLATWSPDHASRKPVITLDIAGNIAPSHRAAILPNAFSRPSALLHTAP